MSYSSMRKRSQDCFPFLAFSVRVQVDSTAPIVRPAATSVTKQQKERCVGISSMLPFCQVYDLELAWINKFLILMSFHLSSLGSV